MNYSRRVALWLFGLHVALAQKCAFVSKLEMISFWLLCWKLLRATAGVKRTNGNELTEECSNDQNQKLKGGNHSEAVTMETSQLSEMDPATECKMDSVQMEKVENTEGGEQFTPSVGLLEATETGGAMETPTHHRDMSEINNELATVNGQESTMDLAQQEEVLVLKVVQEELIRTDSVTSSVSDTPSSPISVYENKLVCDTQDLPDQKQPDSPMVTDDFGDNHILEKVDDHSEVQEAVMESESQKEIQETVLEQQIQEEASSDISESFHNPDQDDDLSDCLHAEIAIVSSDSETDENWRAIFSSTVQKDDCDKLFLDGAQETNVCEQLIQKDTDATGFSRGDEAKTTCNTDILVQPEPTEEPLTCSYDNAAEFHNSTKITEDKEPQQAVRPSSMSPSCATKTNSEKRVPSDYCVIQETKSKDVSTEHVDFQMARKQWLQMEEQTKSQVHHPSTKRATSPGGHSFMYTPVRTINKPKKDPELETLGPNEYPYTQFSPCSEDSGLDDSSYRSAYDDPETPIEREIRMELEREESFRRERGLTKAADSGEHVRAKARSPSFHLSKPDKSPSRDRLPRSPTGSKTPPSFTFTSKPPAAKAPLYHEMAANNVIILEPADPYPTSPRHSPRGPAPSLSNRKFNEWPSETTSVIILETSNLIIRSASELCLNTASQETQESTFHNNPFFKLRSRSTQSLVDQEIKVVKQREEELRRQRARLYTKEKYDTVLVSPNLLNNPCLDRNAELPARCKSSPSSPMKTARKMDRSTLSCDHKYMDTFSGARRKSTLAMRWESGEFAKHGKD
ncbi:uncharacterized protein si:ch211-153l6.6 isoform X1 [Anguilla anguilla]|uniref:uncharacterized protein si:ch211-153l6.6 isoform X1 n=2 Tax=Anguilla anguilla TaxID=7936 RepID=UPI0015AB4ED0|nr:uncharacterized protein si:ch211-153l6.6 isoform X1 [Anguilla anguilla]